MPTRRIALLGSTGSIGTQALEVIASHSEAFAVEVLTAQNNADLLIKQAAQFRPNVVVIGNDNLYDIVFAALDPLGEQRRDGRWQAGAVEPVRERGQHRLAARDADHTVPLAWG